jgi:flagellar biosynthesis protein FlhF
MKNTKMHVKSYYASSVEAAMTKASAELGADAVLMHSRKTPAELRHLGSYEVVFALPQPEGPGAEPEREPSAMDRSISFELVQMRREIEEIRRALNTRGEIRSRPAAHSIAERLWNYLAGAAVDEELAREIADQVALSLTERGSSMDEHCTLSYLVRPEMERRLPPAPCSEYDPEHPPVVVVLGPPGVGKTVSLVKLAVKLQEAYPDVQLVCADAYRIGAADQLRAYGAILGTDVDLAETGSSLRRLIELRRKKGPVLVDTPGLSSADFALMNDLAPAFAAAAGIARILVLPATMRARDLRRVLREYELFHPDRLIFTRLDETDLFGSIYSAAASSGLPVAYFSAGQQVPDDLETATPGRILDLVLGPEPAGTNFVN